MFAFIMRHLDLNDSPENKHRTSYNLLNTVHCILLLVSMHDNKDVLHIKDIVIYS